MHASSELDRLTCGARLRFAASLLDHADREPDPYVAAMTRIRAASIVGGIARLILRVVGKEMLDR